MKRLLILFLILFLLPSIVFAGYVDDGWTYRGYIDLPDPDSTITNFIVTVTSDMIDADIVDYWYGNGADLRFASDSAGNSPFAFRIQNKFAADQIYKVLIPSFTSDTKIYYFVGNKNADFLAHDDTYGSDNVYSSAWEAVYAFDDKQFLPTIATDGYCAPLYNVIGQNTASYYNGVTYIVWQGSGGGDAYIRSYTHSTETWSSAVKVFTNPIAGDSHGAPHMSVDTSGYLHVFGGAHTDPILYFKSDSSEDISAWTQQTSVGTEGTYPHFVKTNSNILVAWREGVFGDVTYVFGTVTDGFQSETTFIEMGTSDWNAYMGTMAHDAFNDYVWFTWCYWDVSEAKRLNEYVAYIDMSDNTIYSYSGDDLGASISLAEADSYCRVVNDATYYAQLGVILLDNNQLPHIVYTHNSATGVYVCHQFYNGSAWSGEEQIVECGNTDNLSNGYFSNGKIQLYVIYRATDNSNGDLQHWEYDGSWTFIRTLIKRTDIDRFADGVGIPAPVKNGVDGLRMVGYGGDFDDLTNSDLPVFAWDNKDNFVCPTVSTVGITTAFDSTTNTNNGAIYGPAAISSKIGYGLYFDGVNDKVTLPNNIFTSDAAVTISNWVQPYGDNSDGATTYQYVYSFLADYGLQCYVLESGHTPANQISPYFIDNDPVGFASYQGFVAETWYHSALVWNGTTVKFFLNGALTDTETPNGLKSYSGNSFLGTSLSGSWFKGTLDELTCMSSAVSDDYIEELYGNQNDPENWPTATGDLEPVGGIPMIQPVIMY